MAPRKITSSTAKKTPKRRAVVPDTSAVDYGHEYPRIPIRPPFVLVYNPQRWTFLAGAVVPNLHVCPLMEGANGLSRDKAGGWQLARFDSRLEKQQRKRIPWNKGPEGSYLAVVETRTESGAVRESYVSAWTQTYAGSSQMGADLEGYVAWLQKLMKAGDLPEAPPYVVERLLSNARSGLAETQMEMKHKETTANVQRFEKLTAEVAALEKLSKSIKRTPAAKASATPSVAE